MLTQDIRRVPSLGKTFLDSLIPKLDDAATLVHGIWYDKKKLELLDPAHPFKGAGPAGSKYAGKRVRVSDITDADEAISLGVRFDPSDKRDIYHPLFHPYAELVTYDKVAAYKNLVSGWAVIQQLGALLDVGEDSINDLEAMVADMLRVDEEVETLTKLKMVKLYRKQIYLAVHNAWGGGELTLGVDPKTHPDFKLYDLLSPYMQSYDIEIATVVLMWIFTKIGEVHRKQV